MSEVTVPIVSQERRSAPVPPAEPGQPRELPVAPTKKFALPKTPAEFRQAVGLPAESTFSTEIAFQTKEKKVRELVEQIEVANPLGAFSNRVVNMDSDLQRLQEQGVDQSLQTRLWRGYMTNRLRLAGITQGTAVLQAIESSVLIYNRRYLKPATIQRLIKTLDPTNEAEALRRFNLAMDRARAFYLIPTSGDFAEFSTEAIEFIKVLSSVPEADIQKVQQQFKGKTKVLSSALHFCAGMGNLEKNGLMQILKQGGLTAKQQEALDKAMIWDSCANTLPIPEKTADRNSLYRFSLSYSDLLDPALTQRLTKYYPYLIDWININDLYREKGKIPPRPLEEDTKTCGGRDFVIGIQVLDANGLLGQLDILRAGNWYPDTIYQGMNHLAFDPQLYFICGQIEQKLTQAVAFQINPEKIAWTKAFREYFGNSAVLRTRAIPFLEQEIANKDTMMSIALILNSLPKQADFKPAEFFTWQDDQVGLNVYELSDYLKELANISEAEQEYAHWLQLLITGEHLTYYQYKEKLPLLVYLAINKDQVIPQLMPEYNYLKVGTALINDLVRDKVPIDPLLMRNLIKRCDDPSLLTPELQYEYFDEFNLGIKRQTLMNLSDEYLAALLAEQQKSIAFFRQLPGRIQGKLIGAGKENFYKYISNGQPTVVLMEDSLEGAYFTDVQALFTDQILINFSAEQRQFFQVCCMLPLEVVSILQHRRAEWGSYFTDGKPTATFVKMVARNGTTIQINQLLAVTDLSRFSQAEQEFWNYYKNNPDHPAICSYLLDKMDQFGELIINGQPTIAFLENAAAETSRNNISVITEVLPFIDLAVLPAEQQAFWKYYPLVNNERGASIRDYLLRHRDQFSQFIVNNQPTAAFLNYVAAEQNLNRTLINTILLKVDWSDAPVAEKSFWLYYRNHGYGLQPFLIKHKPEFSQMVVDEQETGLFYQTLLAEQPVILLQWPKHKPELSAKQYQDIWREVTSKEAIDQFLAALPTDTDEARNAFTGNDYDRTSQFIKYLKDRLPEDEFKLSAGEFMVMAAYVNQFGLSQNEAIYRYFRNFYLLEHQQITALPEEMANLGLTSLPEMIKKMDEVRKVVFSERQLRDPEELRNLTPFQIQILASVTGYDSSRWDRGDANDLRTKVNGFAYSLEQEQIIPLPAGYQTETLEASAIKIEFNAEAVAKDYQVLREEILESIDQPPTVDQLKAEVKVIIDRRVGKINETIARIPSEKARAAMGRDLATFQSYLTQLDEVSDLDNLTLKLLGMNFTSEDRSGGEGFRGVDSIFRRVILAKLYGSRTRSPGFLENVRTKLSPDEVSAAGIDEIVLTIDEMVKNHVLSLDFDNKEGYWQEEIFQAIKANEQLRKGFRRIMERFNPHADKLRIEQASFVRVQTNNISEVKIIPDRGLIGEMAGYLADVCYVREHNMLQTYSGTNPEYPLVVPYKFIEGADSGNPQFMGSVLVFEVQTAQGEPALLVRALDIPKEGEIDIGKFTENLLDKLARVAKRNDKKKVLVAGTGGTISNYSGVTGYVLRNYVADKQPEPVSPDFNFNGYNITNEIYTARSVV